MPPWRWAVLGGLAVVVFDLAAHLAAVNQYSDDILGYIELLDLWLSILVYYAVGLVSSRARGQIRAGAEMGFLAGAIAGAIDLVVALLLPTPSDAPLANQLILVVSQNLFIGGALGALAGWFAVRQQSRPPR